MIRRALPLSFASLALAACGTRVFEPERPPPSRGVWTPRAPLPVAMAEVGVAELNGKIYVVGGTEQAPGAEPRWSSTLTLQYDPATDRWEQRAPLPQGLTHVGVAALDGKIYAVGGFTDIVHMGPRDAAFAYDPASNAWSVLPPISSPRGSVAVAAVAGKLHIFGGRISEPVVPIPSPPGAPPLQAGLGTVSVHQIYDPVAQRWSDGPPVPGPARDHMGIAVHAQKIHLFGGRIADFDENLDRHDVYDPATGRWSEAAPLPDSRSAGAYVVLDGRIIYAGGECKPGGEAFSPDAYDDVTAYDPEQDSWSRLTPLPAARHAFGAAVVDGVAYFAGGAPVCGGGAMTDLLTLTLRRP